MFTAPAIIEYKDGCLRAVLSDDFVRYIKKLFLYSVNHSVKVFRAKYGSHITVYNPLYHGELNKDEKSEKKLDLIKYDGRVVYITYNPEEIYSGGRNHLGYYMPIYSRDIDEISKELGINQELHLSLFTDKHFRK